jgi:hypothetical protein
MRKTSEYLIANLSEFEKTLIKKQEEMNEVIKMSEGIKADINYLEQLIADIKALKQENGEKNGGTETIQST